VFSLLCLALYCALFSLVIQLTTIQAFHTTCSFLSDIKSIDSDCNPISDFVNLHVQVFQVSRSPVLHNASCNSLDVEGPC
jgi:hypothetical protein